jgi:hypothetical protein
VPVAALHAPTLCLLAPPALQAPGTEVGVVEPESTFSACYGGAFLMWHPMQLRPPPRRCWHGRCWRGHCWRGRLGC